MLQRYRDLRPIEERDPLRIMFLPTSMPIGGAEKLLVELIRRLDRSRFSPELCCLKELGPLGEILAREVPTFSQIISNKFDFAVVHRLRSLIRSRKIDAIITVGTGGDRMFWGRLAAWLEGVPVICSAMHSSGLPNRVELLNRTLSAITDAFIAVAKPHARYIVNHEGCPANKVRMVVNGVDVERFHPQWPNEKLRANLGLPEGSPVIGIVAALRPEKNHELFLNSAALIYKQIKSTQFLIVGDGPERNKLEAIAKKLSIDEVVHFVGNREEIPRVLALMDVVLLTSHMEANPVSILEAMATEKPVVATWVGSIPETVIDGCTGFLITPDDAEEMADRTVRLLSDPNLAATMGRAGREEVIRHWSVDRMIQGYQDMILDIYRSKTKTDQNRPESTPDGTFEKAAND